MTEDETMGRLEYLKQRADATDQLLLDLLMELRAYLPPAYAENMAALMDQQYKHQAALRRALAEDQGTTDPWVENAA